MSVRLMSRRRFGTALAAGLLVALDMATPAFADPGFDRWVASFRTAALKSGISAATYDRAFRNIPGPDPEVIEKAHTQPEFTAPMWDYFDNRVQDESIANGRSMARKWKPWLDRIERRFGVDRYILLAIWSMETNYGETLKNDKV
ncbi:MAG: lytic murein transglycosylase, partial [Rhizobiales bacterium]|nr:lytic murein transglycosylase [Hyphomicrobiales bacterium]